MIKEYKTLFECDPYKNHQCDKADCYIHGGSCHQTNHLRFSVGTHPADYGDNQRRQTADIYAKLDVDAFLENIKKGDNRECKTKQKKRESSGP